VVLLRYYELQGKEDDPEFTIWVSSYDKCPWISSPEITKYKNNGYLILKSGFDASVTWAICVIRNICYTILLLSVRFYMFPRFRTEVVSICRPAVETRTTATAVANCVGMATIAAGSAD
jgi:hypothetical protein